jgi:solute:Na+ symporter, SSS family
MQITFPDLLLIFIYLIVVSLLGLKLSGKQKNINDYFLASHKISWWAVSLSIVATETSTLTFISIPAVAYLGNFTFLQIAIGYILGRILVAWKLLPAYFDGNISTVYELLQQRFGIRMRLFSAGVFQITRLLADGVRLFATSIPLHLITGWDYSVCILIIAFFTIIYTLIGGIKAVIWIDVTQIFIYIFGAVLTIFVLKDILPNGLPAALNNLEALGKFKVINFGFEKSVAFFFQTNYTFFAGLIGGAFLSMASHGTDQLIVQRLLCCNSLKDAKKALVASGFIVFFQFALFLFIGSLLYVHFENASLLPDSIFPKFIIESLPTGITGLIIAGIFAAAMSTLSSSINSLASSTHFDFLKNFNKKSPLSEINTSRLISLIWGLVLAGTAMAFRNPQNPVVELGLAIASYTYGGLLGVFLLSNNKEKLNEDFAITTLWAALFLMLWIIGPKSQILVPLVLLLVILGIGFLKYLNRISKMFIIFWGIAVGLAFILIESPQIAWPWYVPTGTIITVVVGNVLFRIGKKVG